MIKKIFLILLIFFISIIPVSADTIINTNTTSDSIEYTFDSELTTDDTVYFNNEIIDTPITDKLIINNLNPNTDYMLIIKFADNTTQSETTKTEIFKEEFYYTYGFIGLIAIIIIFMILAIKFPVMGFIGIMLSSAGIALCAKNQIDKLTMIIFICLVTVNLILFSKIDFSGDNK
jgi:hypothetical protein